MHDEQLQEEPSVRPAMTTEALSYMDMTKLDSSHRPGQKV